MIVPMRKLYLAARASDRDRLIESLAEFGVLHLVPVDPSAAVAGEPLVRRIDALNQALRVLSHIESEGPVPELSPGDAAREANDIQRRAAEGRRRLTSLHHELEQIVEWGNVRLKDLDELYRSGIEVRLYEVPRNAVNSIEAACVEIVARLMGRKVLAAVADREGRAIIPPEAVEVPRPPRDAPAIKAEAAELDAALRRDASRLEELARLAPQMRAELLRLQQQADGAVAVNGAVADEHLFALQGWAPEETSAGLGERLAARGIPAAVEARPPAADEEPPTLVRPPAWVRPIEGLFRMLGTIPAYREYDVSVPFMIALPLFAAILISDGGYGALLLLAPMIAYRQFARAIGPAFTQLLMIIGGASLVWGGLTGSFFGFSPYPPLIPINLSEESRVFMMWLSFTVGAVHLSLAQGWQAIRYFPDPRFVSKVGWVLFVWGMYGVVNMMVLNKPMGWDTPWPYLLMIGAAFGIVFTSPRRNVAMMLLIGIAQFPLFLMSAFSDVISYVRLMAVGLASSVLAVSFNNMAQGLDFWPLAIGVLLCGHGLNLALAIIAMFAHGVRLNMLEFSNHLGMQWSGHAYRPFVQLTTQEHLP